MPEKLNNDPEIAIDGFDNYSLPPPIPVATATATPSGSAASASSSISANNANEPTSVTVRTILPNGSMTVKITTTTHSSQSNTNKIVEIKHFSIPPGSITASHVEGGPPNDEYLTRIEEHVLPPGTVYQPLDGTTDAAALTTTTVVNEFQLANQYQQQHQQQQHHQKQQHASSSATCFAGQDSCTKRIIMAIIIAAVVIFVFVILGIIVAAFTD